MRRYRTSLLILLAGAFLVASVASAGSAPRGLEGRPAGGSAAEALRVQEYRLPSGKHPHDVAPARGGRCLVHGAGNRRARVRWIPWTGRTRHVALGAGSAPHGVIVGLDVALWITDGGLNAIVRVDPRTLRVRRYRLPASAGYANLNTATFDRRADPRVHRPERDLRTARPTDGEDARLPRSARRGVPYGITTTPSGWRLLRVARGELPRPHQRPPRQGDRDQAPDPELRGRGAPGRTRAGRIRTSEWNAGKLGLPNPGHSPLARVEATRLESDAVRGLRRRAGHRVADRLRRECARPLRSWGRPGSRACACRLQAPRSGSS